jgi:DNA-binding response OmpR family regulator
MLIVEDYDAIRAVLAKHYEHTGFTVYSASTLHGALVIARTVYPLIVLMDYELTGRNALHGIRQLREILPHSILVLSGGADTTAFREIAQEHGASALWPEGYDLAVLDRLISNLG